jgi:hypothetical protein
MYDGLPAGLDPVKAGRLGLWLLGKRNHFAAKKRRGWPLREGTGTLASRFVCLIAPWELREYPGQRKLLAALLGVAESYAKRLMQRSGRLPAKHARRLAAVCAEREAACRALADDLDRYATEQEALERPRGFMKDRGKAVGG